MKPTKEWIALLIAYVLLVLIVAWTSFDTQRTLDRIETQNCVAAELNVIAELGVLAVFGEQAGVNEEIRQRLTEVYLDINELLVESCPGFERFDLPVEED